MAEKLARNTTVVFVTAYDQYALDAFERDAVDYLLKPVTDERLSRTIEKLRKAGVAGAQPRAAAGAAVRTPGRRAAARHLRWIRASKRSADGEITQQIPVADVLYFQADDKYTCVFARDGAELTEWLIRVPLSELGEQLNPDDFRADPSLGDRQYECGGRHAPGSGRQAVRQDPRYRARAASRAPVRAPVSADVEHALPVARRLRRRTCARHD